MIRWWSPRLWGVHLLALVAVSIATGMGLWQYDAWQVRREAAQRDLTAAEPVPITELIGADDAFPGREVGRPVTVSGTWLPEGTVLVAGRPGTGDDAGTDGFWLVTPLTVEGTDAAVPVVRGWVPDADDLVPPDGATARVEGWLQPPEGTGEVDEDPADDVLPQLRTADIVQRVDVDLFGAYVVATEPEPGLAPATLDQLPQVGRFTALRNLLYAIEWWLFAAFAAFLWWRYVRDVTTATPVDAAADQEAADDAVVSDA